MRRRNVVILVAAAIIIVGAALFFFLPAPLEAVAASPAQPTGEALVTRGKYLATAGDCVACHSAPGHAALAGGLAFKLPFGTIYSSNITPDRETGIGDWSDAEFVRALHHGVGKGGKDLYPAFPYAAYTKMSTDDALAIRAYLATLPPVRSSVQANALTFPFDQRYLMRGWKLLSMRQGRQTARPDRSAEWNRGAYLVEALGHCGECHTPRNLIFGLKGGDKFAGAVTQGWKAYNITSDARSGIGGWSVDALAAYLATGYAAGHGAASGSMAEAVDLSLRHLTPADLRRMAVYLKSVPAQGGSDIQIAVNPSELARSTAYAPPVDAAHAGNLGLKIFEGACASCHAWNGEGLQTNYAALRGARTVNDPGATNLIQVVLRGSRLTTPQGRLAMPAFGAAYSDAEIAAVSNYVLAHFGDKEGGVTPGRVADARKAGG
ncbi:MAG: c-type cytochrome [Janthinobacterium lividum]